MRVYLLGLFILLTGCSFLSESEPLPAPEQMTAEIDFQERNKCSRLSPAIQMYNVPAATQTFAVKLMEQKNPPRHLGGGTWRHDGTGLIPEGALANQYIGPCFPEESQTAFIYSIEALDKNHTPLARYQYRFVPED